MSDIKIQRTALSDAQLSALQEESKARHIPGYNSIPAEKKKRIYKYDRKVPPESLLEKQKRIKAVAASLNIK